LKYKSCEYMLVFLIKIFLILFFGGIFYIKLNNFQTCGCWQFVSLKIMLEVYTSCFVEDLRDQLQSGLDAIKLFTSVFYEIL